MAVTQLSSPADDGDDGMRKDHDTENENDAAAVGKVGKPRRSAFVRSLARRIRRIWWRQWRR